MRKILAILILAVCILQARIVVDDDGKEVQIVKGFNANNVGPTKRILIRQTS